MEERDESDFVKSHLVAFLLSVFSCAVRYTIVNCFVCSDTSSLFCGVYLHTPMAMTVPRCGNVSHAPTLR